MRTILLASLCFGAIGCATAPQGGPSASAPAQDLRRSAERGETAPAPERGTQRAPALSCGDTVLNDQATSGGEQLTHIVPCTPVPTSTPAPLAPLQSTPAPNQGVAAPSVAQPPQPAKKLGPAIQGPRKAKKGS